MSEVRITRVVDENRVGRAASMMATAFADDPAVRYMMGMPEAKRLGYIETYFRALFTGAKLNRAVFTEANDWQSACLWMPPGEHVDHWTTLIPAGFVSVTLRLGLGSVKRQLYDFVRQTDAYKRKGMPGIRRFWYMFWLGTEASARGQGLASKLITDFQQQAARDGVPLWTEASTPHSREIYRRCGFTVLGEFYLGKGSFNANGYRQKGGPGVPIAPMVWFPEGWKAQ